MISFRRFLLFSFFLNMHHTKNWKDNCTENAPLSPFLTARRTGVRNSSLRELLIHRPVIVFSNISFNFIFISSNILVEVIPHSQKRKSLIWHPPIREGMNAVNRAGQKSKLRHEGIPSHHPKNCRYKHTNDSLISYTVFWGLSSFLKTLK